MTQGSPAAPCCPACLGPLPANNRPPPENLSEMLVQCDNCKAIEPCALAADTYLALNPLVDLDLSMACCTLAQDNKNTQALAQWPRLNAILQQQPGPLNDLEQKVLYLARLQLSVADICLRSGASTEAVFDCVHALAERNIVCATRLCAADAGLHHLGGPLKNPPHLYNSFADVWQDMPRHYATKPVIINEDGSEFYWQDVQLLVNATRHWLHVNTEIGDRVIIQRGACPELFFVLWACLLSQRPVAMLDPGAPQKIVQDVIAKLQPRAMFGPNTLSASAIDFDSLAEDSSGQLYSEIIAPFIDTPPPGEPVAAPHATGFILFTSGSTGTPKGVESSQLGMLHSAISLAHFLGWQAHDRALVLSAVHGVTGIRNNGLCAPATGMSLCLPGPGMMLPQRVFDLCNQFDITSISTVPSQLSLWLSQRSGLGNLPRKLRQIYTGGYQLSPIVRRDVEDWLDIVIGDGYGTTETCGLILCNLHMDAIEGNLQDDSYALLSLVDEKGSLVERGEIGELLAFTPSLMKGYVPGTATGKEPFTTERWARTNDLYRIKADGSYELMGRQDNRMKTRYGTLLYPTELEGCSRQLDGIKDAVCYGDRKNSQHDSVYLFVSTDCTGTQRNALADKLYPHLQQNLEREKLPDKIYVVNVFPVNANGKPNKAQLLELAEEPDKHDAIVL